MATTISKRNKKYIRLISLIFFLVFLSGVVSPILIEKQKNDWDRTLIDKIDKVVYSINTSFETRTNFLLIQSARLKKDLHSIHPKPGKDQRSLFNLLSSEKYQNLSVQIYNSKRDLTAWNSEPVLDGQWLKKTNSYMNQSFFISQKLFTHLCFTDTIHAGEKEILTVVSLPIEKHYSLSQVKDIRQNLADSLSNELSTKVEINYSPSAQFSKDGRKYSFAIQNNYNNKIAVATFDKPSLESEINEIQKTITIIQYLLVITALVILSFWLRLIINKITKRSFRFIIIASVLILFRFLFFVFEIPSSFMRSSINDPSNFSSIFAFGIVRSPLEFLITILVLATIIFFGYNLVVKYFDEKKEVIQKSQIKFVLSIIISVPLFLLSLRGFGAAIRSVVFDSTIRYFKDFSLIPSPPILLMNFNILALGFCSILFSIILLLSVFSLSTYRDRKKQLTLFVLFFVLLQFAAWIFDLIQSEPQGTPIIRIIYISIVFLLAFFVIILNRRTWFVFAYYAFAASIVSVSLLTYYNSQIERESLKTTAHELTRTNEEQIQFMVFQALVQTQNDKRVINSFSELDNFSSDAFIIWTGSLLYKEGIPSALNFFDESHNFLGGYQTGKFVPFGLIKKHLEEMDGNLKIFKETNLYGNGVTFDGIVPLRDDGRLLGYAVVSAIYDEDFFNYADLPKILISQRAGISSAIDFDKLKIYDFHDGKLVRSYGGVNLSPEEQNKILNSDFGHYSEVWLNMNINDEDNLIYALKMNSPSKNKVVAIALEEKNFSWNLSNFFKVFFVHTLIISFLIIVLALSKYRKSKILFTSYRTRLAGAFLVISIIPLIVIALYFRNITEVKNTQLVEKRLTEMSEQVESYLNQYSSGTSVDQSLLFDKAASDLNINFSIYSDKNLLFSSQSVYSEVGLLQSTISPSAYVNCILGKNQKIYSNEKLENAPINSVYSLANFHDQNLIIKVDDLFNKISVPLSDIELDIFLFGVFSLAVLLLFILSTVLADQISSPIRKLTSATKSVGSGDLNVEVIYKPKGEIKDLVDGFNMMVKKIEQSQVEIAQMERESAWKEMAKQVAHEIKNPLTPMKLNVQQLIAAYKDKSQKFDTIFEKVTATIISQIETLKNIASEFSNFARMPRLNIKKLNAVTVIREALNLFEEEKFEIKFESTQEKIFVNADQDQLKRTIINLLRNSLQANARHISIRLLTESGMFKLFVHDDGIGIDMNIISKVFDENFTTKKSGMGIGLSLAKRFVESIGGNISIENTSHDGTTFLITLPLAE